MTTTTLPSNTAPMQDFQENRRRTQEAAAAHRTKQEKQARMKKWKERWAELKSLAGFLIIVVVLLGVPGFGLYAYTKIENGESVFPENFAGNVSQLAKKAQGIFSKSEKTEAPAAARDPENLNEKISELKAELRIEIAGEFAKLRDEIEKDRTRPETRAVSADIDEIRAHGDAIAALLEKK
jgi:hypothetical protein